MPGPPPVVRLGGTGLLVVDWPDPRPESFVIGSDLFGAIVNELNAHRAGITGANVLRGITRDPVTPTG